MYILNAREQKSLEKAQFETIHIKGMGGDYFPPSALGAGIGKKTIEDLCKLGLLEEGYSQYHRQPNCIRISKNGELCLYGGLTKNQVIATCETHNKKFREPDVLSWPPTPGSFF